MPALTYKCKLVNLSFADTGFTFYPTFECYQHKGLRNCLEKVMMECSEYDFIIKFLPNEKPRDENLHFVNTLYEIQFVQPDYDRYIRRKDPDHLLYHKDEFDIEDSHYHIKFKSLLTREKINFILDACIKHCLIDEAEKQGFLESLNTRYEHMRKDINEFVVSDQMADMKNLLAYIKQCEDNDILSNMHQYLLTEKFDYLRLRQVGETKAWQGTNRKEEIVETSEAWAKIEKAITLQMIHNVYSRCRPFTEKIGSEYAQNLSCNYRFFSIKRKATANKSINNAYSAFCHGDKEELERKYNKVFSF